MTKLYSLRTENQQSFILHCLVIIHIPSFEKEVNTMGVIRQI